jgi:hypothetical protein
MAWLRAIWRAIFDASLSGVLTRPTIGGSIAYIISLVLGVVVCVLIASAPMVLAAWLLR